MFKVGVLSFPYPFILVMERFSCRISKPMQGGLLCAFMVEAGGGRRVACLAFTVLKITLSFCEANNIELLRYWK